MAQTKTSSPAERNKRSPAGAKPAPKPETRPDPRLFALEALRRCAFFGTLSEESADELAGAAAVKRHRKGQTIVSENDKLSGFFLLAEGKVRIFSTFANGRERIMRLVLAGDVFGEAAAFSSGICPATAEALDDSVTLFLPTEKVKSLMASDPDLSLAVAGGLAERLRGFRRIVESDSMDPLARLAGFLLGIERNKKGDIQLPLNKSQLALLLGTTAPGLSRALRILKDRSLVGEGRPGTKTLTIQDGEGLGRLARGEER
jgi:CRP/FNR family transcriptional regulator